VAFSLDGHTLLSGGYDNTVRLWDITDLRHPRPAATLTGHTDAINSAAFSPDGHTVITSSDDSTVRLWDTNTDRITKRICALAYPPITSAEWSQYFADLPYQPPCSKG
jgi:WD40 repeat protein